MKPVVVVETSDLDVFEKHCAKLIAEGYEISSTHCGFVQSERYDFCNSYQAILVLPDSKNELKKLAGLAMQANIIAFPLSARETIIADSIRDAKALIAELEKELK